MCYNWGAKRSIIRILNQYNHSIIRILNQYNRSIIRILNQYNRSIIHILNQYNRSIIHILNQYIPTALVPLIKIEKRIGQGFVPEAQPYSQEVKQTLYNIHKLQPFDFSDLKS